MRIRRFNETENKIMSNTDVNKIIDELEDLISIMRNKQEVTDKILNMLEMYSNPSKTSNNQIDDTMVAMREVKKSIDISIDKIDTSLQNMNSYTEDGSEFLYSETK
jgi:hypothetical protein